MNAKQFRAKWQLGILALVGAFLASQSLYWNSINRLHDHLVAATGISEQMHGSEKFHSALHLMLIAAEGYAQHGSESFRSDYYRQRDVARAQLPSLMDIGHGRHASTSLGGDFERYSHALDAVLENRKGLAAATALKQGRGLFDTVFSHLYAEMHQRHESALKEATESAHRIRFWTDLQFYAQLGMAVLIGVLGLIYLERIAMAFLSVFEGIAFTDALTGLFNRRYLDANLDQELGRAVRYGRPLAFAMVDVDHFKRFNDTHGHQAGDQLLRGLAGLMRGNVRAQDRVARYGGEEFGIVFPEMALAEAGGAAEKLRRLVEEQLGGTTVSIGVASFPDDGTTASGLIRAADERLYRAKAAGRNRVVPSGQAGSARVGDPEDSPGA